MSVAKFKIEGNIGDPDPFLLSFGVQDGSVNAQMIGDFIDANPDAETLEIEIDSNGGSVSQGFAIYDKLVASGKKIVTKGYRVNSIATVIFLAGDNRYLSKNAEFVIHNPWIDAANLGNIPLTADALEAISEDVRQSEEKIFNFYVERLKLNDSDKVIVKDFMDQDTDIGANEAIRLGFAEDFIAKRKVVATYTDLTLAKYKSNTNNQMNTEVNKRLTGLEKTLAKISNLFKGKINNGTSTLEDGVVIYYEGDTLEVGTAVFIDEAMTTTAPDGEHILDNSDVIVVVDGVVTEIRLFEAQADQNAELTQKIADLEAANATLTTDLEAERASKSQIEAEVNSLKKDLVAFKASINGDPKKKTNAATQTKTSDKPWIKRIEADNRNKQIFGK
jgi:ATP-dependent protease ClpP protease subunit